MNNDMQYDIGVLARRTGKCWFYVKIGKCCDKDCASCPVYQKRNLCWNQLTVPEQFALEEQASFWCRTFYKGYKSYKTDRFLGKVFIGAMLGVTVFIWHCTLKPTQNYWPHTNYENDFFITYILGQTRKRVRDVDGDGKVNCVDYSVTFKREWDKVYSSENCEILRCMNYKLQFSHLFVRCRKDRYSPWYMVEPQGTDKDYLIQDVWPTQINSNNIYYGETQKWLNYREGKR